MPAQTVEGTDQEDLFVALQMFVNWLFLMDFVTYNMEIFSKQTEKNVIKGGVALLNPKRVHLPSLK